MCHPVGRSGQSIRLLDTNADCPVYFDIDTGKTECRIYIISDERMSTQAGALQRAGLGESRYAAAVEDGPGGAAVERTGNSLRP